MWVQVALLSGLGGALGAPVAARLVRRRFDPFEPIVLFSLAYGVMFLSRPAWMIAHHHLVYDGPRGATDVSATFSRMLVVALLGGLAFILAYEIPLGHQRHNRPTEQTQPAPARLPIAVALVAGALAVVSFVVFLETHPGGFSDIWRGRTTQLSKDVLGSGFYLWYSFRLLIPAAFLLVAVGLERRSRTLPVLGVAFAGLFLLRTLPLGDRSALLPLIGGAFVLACLRRTRRPSVLTLVVLVAVAMVGSAFLSDLRGRSTRGESVAGTIVRSTRPGRVVAPLISGPDSEMAPVLAAALGQIPSKLHYTYGRTIFGDLAARPIPRSLWAHKPKPPRDRLIASLWPNQQTSINPEFSVLLYFFWDFGLYGVFAGMFLFGLGARKLYGYLTSDHGSLGVQIVYALGLWFMVIGLRSSPVDTLVQLVFVVLPAWLAFRCFPSRLERLAVVFSR